MTVKTGVSLPDEIYNSLQELSEKLGYPNISRAIRDAIQLFIAFNNWWRAKGLVTGVIEVLYSKDKEAVERRIDNIILGFQGIVMGNLKFYIEDYILQLIVVDGEGEEVKRLYKTLLDVKGVLTVQPSLIPSPASSI